MHHTTPTGPQQRHDSPAERAQRIGIGHGVIAGQDYPLDDDTARSLLGPDPSNLPELSELIHLLRPDLTQLHTTLGAAPDDDGPLKIYFDALLNAAHMVILRRAKQRVDPHTINSPHGYHRIRVVLTHTSNPYLAPRLPLAGELEVFEMNTVGHVMNNKVVFREAKPDGTLGTPVSVSDIAYTYLSPTTRYNQVHPSPDHSHILREARTYAWARQDATGNPDDRDSDRADQFARLYADRWQAYRNQQTGSGTNLRAAYTNWLRDGTLYGRHECAACGGLLDYDSRPDPRQDPSMLAADPAARRCRHCLDRDHTQPEDPQ